MHESHCFSNYCLKKYFFFSIANQSAIMKLQMQSMFRLLLIGKLMTGINQRRDCSTKCRLMQSNWNSLCAKHCVRRQRQKWKLHAFDAPRWIVIVSHHVWIIYLFEAVQLIKKCPATNNFMIYSKAISIENQSDPFPLMIKICRIMFWKVSIKTPPADPWLWHLVCQ